MNERSRLPISKSKIRTAVRLDMADTGNDPTTNGLLNTPKLPNAPTYGQLQYSTLAWHVLLSSNRARVGKRPRAAVLIP